MLTFHPSLRFLLIPLFACLAACTASVGVEGHASVSLGGVSEPAVEGPIAVGATAEVQVSGASVARAVSSDPSVFRVAAIDGQTITVVGVQPGAATLSVFDATGAEVDRTAITVAAAKPIRTDVVGDDAPLPPS